MRIKKQDKRKNNNIKDMEMFLAMRNIFFGGEFSSWLDDNGMPWAAAKEYNEALEYFCKKTGFVIPEQ